jgi:predicted HicB family RNase H-like nuclease
MDEKKKTSIKIDPELWKEAKIEAIRRGTDVSKLIEEALKKDINKVKDMSRVKDQ